MDNKTAAILLASLLERVEREQTIGVVSSLERQALQLAVSALGGTESRAPGGDAKAEQSTLGEGPVAPTELPTVALVLNSIESEAPTDPDVLMCLDFGTAMSKAFATVSPDDYLELELGAAAGQSGYTLPSSVFIGDNGKLEINRNKIKSNPPEIAAQILENLDVNEEERKWSDQTALWQAREHLQNWLDCVRSRERPVADVEIGHRSITACHLANIARRSGRPLRWDPAQERFVDDPVADALLVRERRKGFELPT